MDEGAYVVHSQGLRTLDQEYVLEKFSGRGCVFQAGYQLLWEEKFRLLKGNKSVEK